MKALDVLRRAARMPFERPPLARGRLLGAVAVVFLLACAVRFEHSVDLAPLVVPNKQDYFGMTAAHEQIASLISRKGFFPGRWNDPSQTAILTYPPGYALLMNAVYGETGRNPLALMAVQLVVGALGAVLVFLLALEFFHPGVALVAGIAAAVSHHFAYYSVLPLPDGLAPVLVVAGTILVARGVRAGSEKNRGFWWFVGAGACYGLSCWLRANAMLLWVVWAVVFFLLRDRLTQPALRAAALALAMAAVVAPVTIRNYALFGEFVPVSLGSGVLLLQGVGEADPSLGLPADDAATMRWEAERYGRPEYAEGLMSPDGLFREKERRARAVEVIGSRPFWYAGVMLRHVGQLVEFTAHAPLIARQPPEGWGPRWDPLRPVLRALQRAFKESVLALMLVGVALGLRDRRAWVLLMVVPVYYLATHATMRAELRYALPGHYVLTIFYALAFYTVFVAIPRSVFRTELATEITEDTEKNPL